MHLIGVPQFVRNADRFRHVVTVLAKHGLADWLSTVPMPWLDRLFRAQATETLRSRYAPRKILSRLRANAEDWEHLIKILPRDTADFLRNLKRGKFDVHLQHRRLEPVVNRLVMGILTAALFMGSASLCSNHVPPTIFGFSVPGFLGCGLALMMGFRITLAIRGSTQK